METPLRVLRELLLLAGLILVLPSAQSAAICSSSSSSNASDTLTDSGGSGSNYSNNETCEFLIQPTGAASITLAFSAFSLESGYDFMTIYDGTSSSAPVLASNLSGSSLPGSVTSSSGSMLIRFTSDFSVTRSGFVASWTSTTGGSCPTETVGDNFPSVSYSQNSGSQNWSGNWTEIGESDGTSAGIARVSTGLCSSGNCLRFGVPSGSSAQTYSNKGLFRETDLSGVSSASLSFVYRRGVNQGSQTVVLSISNNGGTSWSDLQSYTMSSTNTSAVTASFDISSYAANNTQIRFLASGSNAVIGMYIDDLSISYQPSCSPTALIEYRFNEASWNGTNNEVVDSSGNNDHATANPASGLTTVDSGQVCHAGQFDGNDDYVETSSNLSALQTTASLSFWIKTTQTGDDTSWRAPGITGIEESGGGDDIFWGWLDASGRIGISVANDYSSKSTVAINNGVFRHIVLTRDSPTGAYKIYVDGSLNKSGTIGTGDIGNSFSSIGRIEDTGGSPEYFQGELDEVLVFDSVLSDSEVSSIYTEQLAGNNYDGSTPSCLTTPPGGGSMCTSPNSDYAIVAGGGIDVGEDNEVNGDDITEGFSGTNTAIERDGDIATGAVSIPAIDPEPFPTNTSTTDIDDDDSPIHSTGEVYYDDVYIDENETLSFTGGGVFHIDNLTADKKSDIRFSAGTYFINQFHFDHEKVDLIIDSGPVVLHIGTSMTADRKEVDINKNGNFEDLQILLHSGATIDFQEKKFKINAIILGPDSGALSFGKDLEFRGVIHTSNRVTLGEDTELTLSSGDQSTIDNVSICIAGASNLDHFVITHDGSGINCLSEIIQLTATDSTGDALEDYVESITLDTQTGKGTWALSSGSGSFGDVTSNDGLATYTFHDDDDGAASFSLSYQEGTNSLDLEAYQTSDTNLRDDDRESTLVFGPSGFTLTQNLLSNPPPATINDPIVTQTAGSNFSVHITAYGQTPTDTVCGVIEAYTGAKDLAFWFDYEDPNSGTIAATIDTNAIATSEGGSSTQSVTFTNGQASVTAKYSDVGEIQVHTKDGTISGSTTPFVVKPSTIVITDIETSGGSNNPGATTATGSGFVAAGESFTVTLEVRGADGALTPNFGNESTPEGIELIASSLVLPASGRNGSGNDGAIANASTFSATAPAGTFTGTQFSWDEYGIIKLQASIADDDYLGVGEITGGESGEVGRFYPAGFALSSSNVAAACNGFTYMSQPELSLSYDLEAQGTAGNQLFNYDVALLGSAGVSSPYLDIENNNQGTNLNSRLTSGSSSWINGGYSYSTLTASFNRAAAADGPYTALTFGVSANDLLDSRTIGGLDMNAATSTNCVSDGNCDARALTGSSQVLYGRLEVSNTFGPEIASLDVKMNSSYFDGADFVVNTADNCTAYINSDATLSNYQGGLPAQTVDSPSTINLLQSGETGIAVPLMISAPGAGNVGSVDLTYDAPAWLEFDWNGSGDEDPTGTASFGHFRGHDKVIYWREVLN